jgi:hypothetical protein
MKLTQLNPCRIRMKRKVEDEALAEMRDLGDFPIFQIGLREVGLVAGPEYWWDCELFQVGLRELGLA